MNPLGGERIVFRQTAADTGGEALVLESQLPPGARSLAAHVHPAQEERFQVVRGEVGFALGARRTILGPGQRVTVPAGVGHAYWNVARDPAQLVAELRPALDFESLLETLWRRPPAAGRGRGAAVRELLRVAVVAEAHLGTLRLSDPYPAVQRGCLWLAARLGRLGGLRPYPDPLPRGTGCAARGAAA